MDLVSGVPRGRVDGIVVWRDREPWTATVQRLLGHLEAAGCTGAPRVAVADDGCGHEALRYIEGDTAHPRAWSDAGVVGAGALLRIVHDACATFERRAGDVWQPWYTRSERPDAIIGHGDPGPWNTVALAGLPIAFIDWEFAGPVDRLDEVAHAAWLQCQLHDDDVAARQGLPSAGQRARQLRLFLDAYGLRNEQRHGFVQRMIDIALRSCAHDAREAGIEPHMTHSELLWGIVWRARSADWLTRHRAFFQNAITEQAVG